MSEQEQRRIFCENLNRIINERSLAQVDIAHAIHVSPQTFNTWTTGKAIPRMGKLQALADYFKVPKSALIEAPQENEENDMNKTLPLTDFEKESCRRIRMIIDVYCDGSQQVLAEKTGLNKVSVSQYVNEKNVPSSFNAKRIADAFNINPAWIMGFDVPLHDEPAPLQDMLQEMKDNPKIRTLLSTSRDLNDKDLEMVIDMVKRLRESYKDE